MKLLFAAAIVPALIVSSSLVEHRPQTVAGCYAIDGDTLSCQGERIRIMAIDAPEMPSHPCPPSRQHCTPGDGRRSKMSLGLLLSSGSAVINRHGLDGWRRTVADVHVGGISAACWQIQNGNAVYWERYDRDGIVKQECHL